MRETLMPPPPAEGEARDQDEGPADILLPEMHLRPQGPAGLAAEDDVDVIEGMHAQHIQQGQAPQRVDQMPASVLHAQRFLHTRGAKRKSTGKISSLPSSISRLSVSFDRSEKKA